MSLLEHWIDNSICRGGEREMVGQGREEGKEIRMEGGKNGGKRGRRAEGREGKGKEKKKKKDTHKAYQSETG